MLLQMQISIAIVKTEMDTAIQDLESSVETGRLILFSDINIVSRF